MAKVTFLTFYIDYSVGVYVLSSILQDAGHDVSVIIHKLPASTEIEWFGDKPINIEEVNAYGNIVGTNNDVNPWTAHETRLLISKLNDMQPDVLCVSSRSTHNKLVKQVLPEVRKNCAMPIVAGGFGPTLDPELYVELVDYVFLGEAENAITELIESLAAGRSIDKMDNICYQHDGQLVRNPLRRPDISQFRYQKIPVEMYYIDHDRLYGPEDRSNIVKTHTYSTFFGRGCISSCSYCSAGHWHKIYNNEGIKIKKRRNRPLEDVMNELISIRDEGYTFVHFRDEFLCADVDTLKRFFKEYEREIGLPFWAYLVPEQVLSNPELLELAADAGFVDTEIGLQSGSDQINRDIFTRHISNQSTVAYTRMLSDYEINMKYDFIFFNPAETEADVRATFDLIRQLPKERAYINISRLHYFPVSPIVDILKPYAHLEKESADYYRSALLYLLRFVMNDQEFGNVLKDEKSTSSWQLLKSLYQNYLQTRAITFPVGTHAVPGSITTHRYRRILQKNDYKQVDVWGAGRYFMEMRDIFPPDRIRHLIDDSPHSSPEGYFVESPEVISSDSASTPIFICSPDKQEVKLKIKQTYPQFRGRVYV